MEEHYHNLILVDEYQDWKDSIVSRSFDSYASDMSSVPSTTYASLKHTRSDA